MNNEKLNYYGSDEVETVSYLEFGSIDLNKAKKTVWAYWHDQQAYDLYMFSRYARDLFIFREFVKDHQSGGGGISRLNECILASAHNKLADYLFKYAGLITAMQFQRSGTVCESGSSLFGWIDEAIACDLVFNNGINIEGIKSMKYLGSDISSFMNFGAEAFHPGISFQFSTAPTIADLLNDINKVSLFYGLGVSMRYALRDAKDLLAIAQKSDLAIFNRLSVTSQKDTFSFFYGSGKCSYVISLPALTELLNRNNIHARYNTAGIQREKDGEGSLRISIVMSKDADKVKQFILNNNDCTEKSAEVLGEDYGQWGELCQLTE